MPEAAARGRDSLTEGGADAAINVLDPMDLVQGLHCVLGEVVLQDDIQRMRGQGSPHPTPSPAAKGRKVGVLEVERVNGSHEKESQHLQL